MIFPAPDLTAPSAVQPASTLAVANGLLGQLHDTSKVNVAVLMNAAGAPTIYPDAGTALGAAQPTDTVVLRGPLIGGFGATNSCSVDATGVNVGLGATYVGAFPPTAIAQTFALAGLLSQGRVVAIAQAGPTPSHWIFADLHLSGAAHLEFYALGVPSNGVVDTIELRNCTVRKTAIHQAVSGVGSLGEPLFVLQSRNDYGQRPVAIVVGSGCDLQNDVGPVFGGYIAGGSTITLQERCRVVPAPGRAIQEVCVQPAMLPFYTNAVILIDQRTGYVPIALNQYGTGKPARALLTQNDFDAYLLGG